MLSRSTTLTGLLVFFIPCSSALAQNDDPFGNPAPATENAASDPFGDGAMPAESASDPFGKPNPNQKPDTKPSADPFGGGTAPAKAAMPNPFDANAAPAKSDPADPFGGPVPSRPTATKPKSMPLQANLDESQVNQKIREKLNELTTQTFIETPLVEAIEVISRDHDIPIVADQQALEEIGLSLDVPVTLDLRDVTLRSFLRLMLRELHCTYVVKNEVLQITTIEAAEKNLVVKSYTMNEELSTRAEKIIKALTSSVIPEAWSQSGGPCAVNAVDHVLVVAGTETIHEEVAKFMKMLADAFEKKTAK